jgi:tetratricopeptide (TPR) repeat protein
MASGYQTTRVILAVSTAIIGFSCRASSDARLRLAQEAAAEIDKGREHMHAEEWPAAILCFGQAIRRDPKSADAYLLRATAINNYLDAGYAKGHPSTDYTRQDALSDLARALELQPNSGEAHLQRGYALAGIANVDEARKAFSMAIPLLKDPTQALVERAAIAFLQRDYQAAVSNMTAVIERNPAEPEYYETRAMYRPFAGDSKGAKNDREQAAKLRQDSKTEKGAGCDVAEETPTPR